MRKLPNAHNSAMQMFPRSRVLTTVLDVLIVDLKSWCGRNMRWLFPSLSYLS